MWYYLLKEGNKITKLFKEILDWEIIKDTLEMKSINDMINWLNEDLEVDLSINQRYKYIWGKKEWVEKIKEKYIDQEKLKVGILEQEKYKGILKNYHFI